MRSQCICEHILLRTWSASLFKGPRFWRYNPNPSTISPHPHLREGQRCVVGGAMIDGGLRVAVSRFKLRLNFWWWHQVTKHSVFRPSAPHLPRKKLKKLTRHTRQPVSRVWVFLGPENANPWHQPIWVCKPVTFPSHHSLKKQLPSPFNKATDCFCPFSARPWDGNVDVVKKFLELLGLRVTWGQVQGTNVGGPKKRQCNVA
jgi:hypothetical protein